MFSLSIVFFLTRLKFKQLKERIQRK